MQLPLPIDLFISYSSRDSAIAMRIFHDLTRHGLNVFLYEEKARIRKNFQDEIFQAIDHAKYFCLIDSTHARASKWVKEECQKAISHIEKEQFIRSVVEPIGIWQDTNQLQGENQGVFEEINLIQAVKLFEFTFYDHDEVYDNCLLQILSIISPHAHILRKEENNSLKNPNEIDFERELANWKIKGRVKEMLLHDFHYVVSSGDINPELTEQRLNILLANMSNLGYSLSTTAFLTFLEKNASILWVNENKEVLGQLCEIYFPTTKNIEEKLFEIAGHQHFNLLKSQLLPYFKRGKQFRILFWIQIKYYFEKGDYQRMLDAIQACLAVFPDEARAWNTLGRYYLRKGNFKAAAENMEKALAIINQSQSIQKPSAQHIKNNIFLLSNKFPIIQNYVICCLQLHQLDKAENTIKALTPAQQELPEIIASRIRILLYRSKQNEHPYLQQARDLFHQLHEDFSQENTVWTSYKLTQQKLDRIIDLELQAKLTPLLGQIFFSDNTLLEALKTYLSQNEIQKQKNYLLDLAKLYRNINLSSHILADIASQIARAFPAGKKDQGIPYLQLALELNPYNFEVIGNLALKASIYGKDELVASTIQHGLQIKPLKLTEFYYFGFLNFLNEDHKQARYFYKKSKELGWVNYHQLV